MRSDRLRRARRAQRLRGEDGNTLLLMPVGVLILLVLGAIAVDFAIIYSGQREVANLTAGLANDAAGAVDEASFFDGGVYAIDLGRARTIVSTVVANRPDDSFRISCPTVDTPEVDVVRVACTAQVDLIFSPALPGSNGTYTVRADSTARAAEG